LRIECGGPGYGRLSQSPKPNEETTLVSYFTIVRRLAQTVRCVVLACVFVLCPFGEWSEAIEHSGYNKTLLGLSCGYGLANSMAPEPVSGYSADNLDGKSAFYVACSIGKWNGLFGEGRFCRNTMTLTEEPAPSSPPDNVGNLAVYSVSFRFGYQLAPVGERISAIGFGYRLGAGLGYQFIDFREGYLIRKWERELGVNFESEFSPSTIAILNAGVEVAISSSISLTAEGEYVFSHTNWKLTVDSPYMDELSQRADVNASSLLLLLGVRVWFVK
jgi:hypothetical protein